MRPRWRKTLFLYNDPMTTRSLRLSLPLILAFAACTSGNAQVTNFEECVAAGNPVMESYPRQCATDGQSFTEDIGNAVEKQDLIRADRPKPGDLVQGTITIDGQARGTWYFEASFPIRLEDSDGNELAVSHAEAQSDWMMEDFVPFLATITVPATSSERGTLILEKDNPSGMAENADELRIPVKFR